MAKNYWWKFYYFTWMLYWSKWTKNVDIFEKEILLIPICEAAHWYLLAVILPGLLLVRKQRKETTIIVFDSLRGNRDDAVANMKAYLKEELEDKKNIVKANIMKTLDIYPQCPQQADLSSCGAFLLHYAEQILSK